jgi:hypothetical protein
MGNCASKYQYFVIQLVRRRAQGAICGICSTGGLERIARPTRDKVEFARGPTNRHMNNRNYLMKLACFFMLLARFGVDWFVLRSCGLAQSPP